jgi:hypothetical protein
MTNSAHLKKELWKAGHAWLAFKTVRETCDYILAHDLADADSIIYPCLVAGICTLYARPFILSRRGPRLVSDKFVPPKHRKLHNQLILGRRRTIAHSDAELILDDLSANTVGIVVKTPQMQLRIHSPKLKPSSIPLIRDLASGLADRVWQHTANLVRNHPDEFPEDGEYLIDLATGQFVPAPEATSLVHSVPTNSGEVSE